MDPDERYDERCGPYSTASDRYAPGCVSCRKRFDLPLVSTAKKKSLAKKTEKPIRRREPLCTVCDRPVMCGQGDSHYECRPRCLKEEPLPRAVKRPWWLRRYAFTGTAVGLVFHHPVRKKAKCY